MSRGPAGARGTMHAMDEATATREPQLDEDRGDGPPPDSERPSDDARGGDSPWATAAWIASSLLLVVLVVGIWLRVSGDRAGAELGNAIIEGQRPAAPALPAEAVADGSELPDWYRVEDGRQVGGPHNQVLVVNWWASWCGPCREEAPILNEVAREYRGRVAIVGMNPASEDLHSDARGFARDHELDFPLVRGGRSYNDAWGVNGYPETFVVGTDGRISSFINGPVDERSLRGLLEAELAEDRT